MSSGGFTGIICCITSTFLLFLTVLVCIVEDSKHREKVKDPTNLSDFFAFYSFMYLFPAFYALYSLFNNYICWRRNIEKKTNELKSEVRLDKERNDSKRTIPPSYRLHTAFILPYYTTNNLPLPLVAPRLIPHHRTWKFLNY